MHETGPFMHILSTVQGFQQCKQCSVSALWVWFDHDAWHGIWLAMCKTANAPWDLAKSVLFFYCFADEWMFNRSSEFLLTSVTSLMVFVFKWKGRWHWQFSPAVIKMYPAETPTLWCVIISYTFLKSSTSARYILCISFFWTMFHSLFKWFSSGMGSHIWCISFGEY